MIEMKNLIRKIVDKLINAAQRNNPPDVSDNDANHMTVTSIY